MFSGDCIIIVLDSSGVLIGKKQFGITGEVDLIAKLAFASSKLYIYGTFTGATYSVGSNLANFFYMTQPDFAGETSCN